jgi:NAD(P)-dependent dehydrogenase (short-subunit alcohol dehydrogenase family)
MQGKTIIITGATSGIGEATALDLAARGAAVLAVGRDAARGEALRARLQQVNAQGAHQFFSADISTKEGRAGLVSALRSQPRIDALVNNAGGSFSARALTADGVERTFALNVLAPFSLVRALRPALKGGAVVNLVTSVPKRETLQLENAVNPSKYGGLSAYSKAKLALEMVTVEQAARFPEIKTNCAHPGIILGTRFGSDLPKVIMALSVGLARLFRMNSSTEEAASCVRAALEGEAGLFFAKSAPGAYPAQVSDAALRQELWKLLESLDA